MGGRGRLAASAVTGFSVEPVVEPPVGRPESAILGGTLVLAAFLVSFGALHYGVFTKNLLLDTPLYERYGDAIVHGGKVPYRDFGVEYPPGALLAFAAPSLIASSGDFPLYARLFEGLMLVCGAVASGLVAYVLTKQRAGQHRLIAGNSSSPVSRAASRSDPSSPLAIRPLACVVDDRRACRADRRSRPYGVRAAGRRCCGQALPGCSMRRSLVLPSTSGGARVAGRRWSDPPSSAG